jgi:hypothetical protein
LLRRGRDLSASFLLIKEREKFSASFLLIKEREKFITFPNPLLNKERERFTAGKARVRFHKVDNQYKAA